MSRRLFVTATFLGALTFFGASEARAQELARSESKLLFMPNDATSPAVAPALDDASVDSAVAAPRRTTVFDSRHTTPLLPLYASTVLLQALDVHSTLRVLGHGGGEGNPLMQGVVSNRGVFVAAKAGVAAASIFAASRIAKRSKVGAIITLVGLNSAYAFVVSHNYKLANELR
jgi:hypothetical protein